MAKTACAACRHEIDSAAKICPYCGSDPQSGQKIVDSNAMLQEMFHPRRLSASESLLEYARQRQGIMIAAGAVLLIVILAGLHQFVTMRNQSDVSAAPAVPLSDVVDISNPPDAAKPAPMPELNFQYDGNADAMRTYIVEPGAVAPPRAENGAPASAGPQPQQAVKTTPPAKAGAPSQPQR